MFNRISLSALAIIAALLSACAQLPKTPVADSPGRPAQALTQWHMKGKVGITTLTERVNASINWQQQESDFSISLSGPFGQGRADLIGDASGIVLATGGQTYRGTSAKDLMQQQLGWSVPVQHFTYWAKGIPSPLAPVTGLSYDEQGSLSALEQDGWQVSLSRYTTVDGWQLPGRMSAKTDQIALLVVAKEWLLD